MELGLPDRAVFFTRRESGAALPSRIRDEPPKSGCGRRDDFRALPGCNPIHRQRLARARTDGPSTGSRASCRMTPASGIADRLDFLFPALAGRGTGRRRFTDKTHTRLDRARKE